MANAVDIFERMHDDPFVCGCTDNQLAQLTIAQALFAVAEAVHALGTNHAVTAQGASMGAIEFLAKEINDGFDTLAHVISEKE